MDQAINGKLTEEQYIGFAEPDLLFICPELAENEEPYIEMRLYLHLSDYTGEYYSLMIETSKLVQFRYFLDYCLNAMMTTKHGIPRQADRFLTAIIIKRIKIILNYIKS